MAHSVRNFVDRALERSVVPSFTSMGPAVRRRLFDWPTLESFDLTGKVVVLSGGTSGIGQAAARVLARQGATLVLLARDADKTEAAIRTLGDETGNRQITSVLADLADQSEVRRAAAELQQQHSCIDVLIHNAGALFSERKRAANGTDLSVELMVAGPFLLTALLLPVLRAVAPARVLTMSSGGMYTQGLHVEHLQMPDEQYQGAKQYARAKRAQVVLNELWASHIPASEIVFHSLHPGWVETPGITEALPGFSKVLQPLGLLRAPREGADTLVWLAAAPEPARSSGQFWHDRQPRSTNLTGSTREADTSWKRQALWQWCCEHCSISIN